VSRNAVIICIILIRFHDSADDADAIFLDIGTRIQVLETISEIAGADKEQCGAFVVCRSSILQVFSH